VLDIEGGARARARHHLVRDVMATRPKTLAASASIDDARSVLADDHVHMVLLTRGATLLGTLVRADLPPGVPGDGPALPWSTLSGRTAAPDAPAAPVRELLVRTGLRRLAVVDEDGTLLGLLCLKSSGAGFCSDADITSRAMAATTDHGAPR
jgi:CBS domain-containing protein